MPPRSTVTPEALLSNAGWVRALARSLVSDSQTADDLAQETLLAAIEHGPAPGHPLRAWLSHVVRNFARKSHRADLRRLDREASLVHPDPAPSPADLCERAALHRDLVEAVMALDEPYRATILLRYFENLPPRVIASRDGTPVRTVDTRIARGLAQLRAHLDARWNGDRGAWMVAVVSLAKESFHAGSSTGLALLMNTKLKIAIGVLVLMAITATWLRFGGGRVAPGADSRPDAITLSSGGALTASRDGAALEGAAPVIHEGTPSARAAPAVASAPVAAIDPALDLHGRVMSTAGVLLSGAHVEVRRNESRGFSLADLDYMRTERTVAETRSDQGGEFHVALPRGRSFDLYVNLSGYATQRFLARCAGEYVKVELPVGCTISGSVTRSANGAPCAGARMIAVLDIVHGPDPTKFETVCDANGAYRFEGLPPGAFELDAFAGDEVEKRSLIVEAREGENTELNVSLEAGMTVTGTISDSITGAPIAGAEVATSRRHDKAARTDADGRYTLRGVSQPVGRTLSLCATAEGFASTDGVPQSDGGGALHLDLRLEPGRKARGRVLGPDGWPLADAYVAAFASAFSVSGDCRSTRTAADGTFTLSALRADDQHTLFVRKDECGTRVYDFPPHDSARDLIDFGDIKMCEPAMILGRVVDENGSPVPDMYVGLDGVNSDWFKFSDSETGRLERDIAKQAGRTDDRGRFGFTDLSGGEYMLTVTGNKGSATSTQLSIQLTSGEVREDLELVLRVGRVIEGRVIDPDGHGIPGTSVTVYSEPYHLERAAYDISRGGGLFHLQGLEEGTYTIRVEEFVANQENGMRDLVGGRWTSIPSGSRDLRLVLSLGAWITGSVVDPEGAPVVGCQVKAFDAECSLPDGDWSDAFANTDASGRFRLKVRASSRVNLSVDVNPHQVDGFWRSEFGANAKGISAGATDVVLKLLKLP